MFFLPQDAEAIDEKHPRPASVILESDGRIAIHWLDHGTLWAIVGISGGPVGTPRPPSTNFVP